METKDTTTAAYLDEIPTCLSQPQKPSIPFAHKELQKSLEQVISDSKSKQDKSQLEDMLSDKSKSLKASVNALLEEIKLREDLNTDHTKQIDDEVNKQRNELIQLKYLKDSYSFNLSREIEEAKEKIEENILELEKEKRTEALECWRDLMFLKKYLMVSLKDYWDLNRKRRVLNKRS